MADQEANVMNEKYDYYITTKDNPYDPKTQFDEWYAYDLMLGYNTLQRLAKTEDYLASQLQVNGEDSEVQDRMIHNAAISEMIRLDPLYVYTVNRYEKESDHYVELNEAQKEERKLYEGLKRESENYEE